MFHLPVPKRQFAERNRDGNAPALAGCKLTFSNPTSFITGVVTEETSSRR
jgi:hypothetical protein